MLTTGEPTTTTYSRTYRVSAAFRRTGTYCGEQHDPDLGLYYLRARYYNPLTGRFMSRDPNEPKLRGPDGTPIDPGKLHKYLYAGGDPINLKDPTGREEAEEQAGPILTFTEVEVGTTSFTRDVFLCIISLAAEAKGVLSPDPDLLDVVLGDIGLLGCPVASPYGPGPAE